MIPDVSVVIVNWNTRDLLARAVVSVRKYSGELKVETIVVDNGSTDGSAQMIYRLYSNVQLIANGDNVGYTRAANQGLAAAQGRYILFLNSDAEVTEGCLETLVRVMDAHREVGACSPRWGDDPHMVPAGVFPRLWMRLLPVKVNQRIERRRIEGFYRDRELFEVEWIIGACLMVRREVVRQIGGMEERLFMWYDDAEWCLRMKQAGWRRVIVPGAKCLHEHGASAKKVPSLQADFRMTMAEYTYWRLHKGWVPTFVLYTNRVLRLWLGWSRWVVANLLAGNRDPEVKGTLKVAAARLGWHLRHMGDILLRAPKAYRGE
jgi:GT2 family glycosyltransferase